MKIPIVNENDEIIGCKDRKDRNPDDIIRIVIVWITDENGNILLQQRSLKMKVAPGMWGPAVSGHVEEEEDYDFSALRELEEEIGLKDIKLVKLKKIFGSTNTGKRFAQIYSAQINSNSTLVPQDSEVEQLKWFSKEELLEFFKKEPEKFPALMKDLIELFLK
jgi:isopentenyldiphosphate isomerase